MSPLMHAVAIGTFSRPLVNLFPFAPLPAVGLFYKTLTWGRSNCWAASINSSFATLSPSKPAEWTTRGVNSTCTSSSATKPAQKTPS